MPIFQSQARTAQSYLAGIGASGALLASAFVMFVILIGAVTFNSWPHGGRLFPADGDMALNASSASPAPQPKTLNLAKLLGGGQAAATSRGGGPGRGAPIGVGRLPGTLGGSQGGSNGTSPGPGGGPGTVAPQPPSPPPPTQATNLLSQTVSGAGNTVQSSTESLGSTVNTATGTNVGNVVSGVGDQLNSDLQTVAGQLSGQ
jgi:hypothetical protein